MNRTVARLDSLTGLRFVAAFAVFAHHFGDRFHFLDTKSPLGAQAVSFFFVLSGFILTYVYHGRLKKSGVVKFYFTRWARIWPLHAVCLALVLCLFRQGPNYGPTGETLRLGSHWLLLQSWVPLREWIFSYNGVAWSILTEAFFYLMFPLLFLGGQRAFWKKYIGLVLLFVGGLLTLKWLAGFPAMAAAIDLHELIHVNPLLRLIEFGTGMATGFLFLNRSTAAAPRGFWRDSCLESVTLLLALSYDWALRYFLVYYSIRQSAWGGPEVLAGLMFSGGLVFFAPLIYVFARSNGIWGRFVRCRPLVYLGEISFAFYMVHQIVLRWLYAEYWVGSTLSPVTMLFASLLISIGASSLLYALVEIPVKNALVSLYERRPRVAVRGLVESAGKNVRSPWAVWTLLMLLLPIVVLSGRTASQPDQPGAELILNRTPSAMREIAMGPSMTLMGWTLEPRREGVQLNLVWRKDANDDSVWQRQFQLELGDRELTLFPRKHFLHRNRPGDLIVERIFLHRNRYRESKRLALLVQSEASPDTQCPHEFRQVLVSPRRWEQVEQQRTAIRLR